MPAAANFTINELEAKVAEQLKSQRVGYLLGAGSSFLGGRGYPLAGGLWEKIRDSIASEERAAIQGKLDGGAAGIEAALDLLDDGGANDTPYRHLVTAALATLFMPMSPPLDLHSQFVGRIAQRADSSIKVFSLNYDPLIEKAAAHIRVRLTDGFQGVEPSYFDPASFEERIGRIRGTHKGRQFDETVRPLQLFKLHGSLGWYECPTDRIRRCGFDRHPPGGTRRLMIPPQRRKAADTMIHPYATLWSAFRGCLAHDAAPINRLVCIGYGFADEHVNAVIEAALARSDLTLLIFAKELGSGAWSRWSAKTNVIVVTETQCAMRGMPGPGHPSLWSFERLAKEV